MFNLNFRVNRKNPDDRHFNQTETITDYAAALARNKGIHYEISSG